MLTPVIDNLKAPNDRISASEYNRRGKAIQSVTRSLVPNAISDSSGMHQRRSRGANGISSKIFEVQSAAAGDGVYNCYEQSLDATDWTDTGGADKLDNKDAVSVEVLNLLENDPEAAYSEMLVPGDKIKAWEFKDDENNTRWVGVPISGTLPRRARTRAAAGAGTTIACNLIGNDGQEILAGLGSNIIVNCSICNGADLDEATPLLEDNIDIFVQNIQGKWWCGQIFDTHKICVCEEPP